MERVEGFFGRIRNYIEKTPALPSEVKAVIVPASEFTEDVDGRKQETRVVYVLTNIPLGCCRERPEEILNLLDENLRDNKDFQEALGERQEGISIPIGEKKYFDPRNALIIMAATLFDRQKMLALRYQRATVGQVVQILNKPGSVQRLLGASEESHFYFVKDKHK